MAVVGVQIVQRTALANGLAFGAAGPYERIVGVLECAVDPALPCNAGIADLALAPRGEDGRVHFAADFEIMQPVNPERRTGRLLFDVLNRGKKIALRYLNNGAMQLADETEPDLGDGFLMRRGYTVAWCGWQQDIPSEPGLLALRVPEALNNGARIVGRVMCELEPALPTQVMLLSDRGHRPYPAKDVGDPSAELSVREYMGGPRRSIPRDRWQFARLDGGRVVPDPSYLYLPEGFEGGKYYDLVYTTEGAPVIGLGLVGARDLVAWLRYGDAASGNPSGGSIRYAYGFGVSQSGRYLRHLLSVGLNEDEARRQVFDGLIPFIAGARRGEFNARFGQPSKLTVQMDGTQFPFSDVTQTDPVTGHTDGLLARLTASSKVPKIITLSSSTEYWGGAHASLVHTTVDGARDVELPDSSRVYLMAGTQHGAGTLPLQQTNTTGARGVYALNSVDQRLLARAALVNLDRWVSEGELPPPSLYPSIDQGTAVSPDKALGFFRSLPGGHVPNHVPQLSRLDYGPEADWGLLTTLPPRQGAPYPIVVSAVDSDGNEVAGIRQTDIAVPLGTYTGWNVHDPKTGVAGEVVSLAGATIPFARTAAERKANGDPRPSIEERYASKEDYLGKVRRAADELVAARYLLEEDVALVMEQSSQRWDLFTAEVEPAPLA